IGAEEERLVADHRPTESAAELIESANRLLRRGEKVAGVELLVLAAVKRRAAKIVCARSADHVDLPAGDTAVLRAQHLLDDLDFRDRVEAHDGDLILTTVLGQ